MKAALWKALCLALVSNLGGCATLAPPHSETSGDCRARLDFERAEQIDWAVIGRIVEVQTTNVDRLSDLYNEEGRVRVLKVLKGSPPSRVVFDYIHTADRFEASAAPPKPNERFVIWRADGETFGDRLICGQAAPGPAS